MAARLRSSLVTSEAATLTDCLLQAIERERQRINASRIAQGKAGRIEINVNLAVNRVVVQVLLPEDLPVG